MKIKEVLKADWTIDEIKVTVRKSHNTEYIIEYRIGKNSKPTKYERFECETNAGDRYRDGYKKIIIIKKNIQFRNMEKRPQGKELCVGVLIKEIPKEILELEIDVMHPYGIGTDTGMHGYRFDCYVDFWSGIKGE